MNRPNKSKSENRNPSGKQSLSQSSSFDDLPEAVRERPIAKPKASIPVWAIALAGFVGVGLFIAIGRLLLPTAPVPASLPTQGTAPAAPQRETVLGHYAYPEAPENELAAVSADGGIRLRKAAAEAYQAMVADAQAAGVRLAPLSGFRSVQEQESVFFDVKQQRSQTVSERADVSAPPGHSEHHTGYAIDIGDGDVPATNLSVDFENTSGFKWLEANAAKYSFELSFPKGNPQGVTYEPWHWRFVGDRASLETFFKAKNSNAQPASPSSEASPSGSPQPDSTPAP